MRVYYANTESTSYNKILTELGNWAHRNDLVHNGYTEMLLEREEEFPTGLNISNHGYGVAIPHTDPDYVDSTSIAVTIPKEPIEFKSMDNPEEYVEVDIILLLLIASGDEHSGILSELTDLFQKPDFANAVNENNSDKIMESIRQTINQSSD